jgi:hypothetical protein
MNSYFLMYEFISGRAMCEVPPSLWRHLIIASTPPISVPFVSERLNYVVFAK